MISLPCKNIEAYVEGYNEYYTPMNEYADIDYRRGDIILLFEAEREYMFEVLHILEENTLKIRIL